MQQQLKDNLWSPSNLMRFPSSLHVVIKHLTLLDNRKDVLSYWTSEYVEMVHSLNSLPGYGMSTTDVGASLGYKTSQNLSNRLLSGVDRHVSRPLHRGDCQTEERHGNRVGSPYTYTVLRFHSEAV